MISVLGLPLAINSISRMTNSGAINWHHPTIMKMYITAIELTELIKKIPIRVYLNQLPRALRLEMKALNPCSGTLWQGWYIKVKNPSTN